jgi:acyl-coenzyme A synthetase/AMP-(fatty) acid ligase
MKKLFLHDSRSGLSKTYDDLIFDLNNILSDSKYIYTDSVYKIFLRILHSLINKNDVCLLDGKFTNEEISNLGLSPETIIESEPLQDSIKIACTSQLLRCLNDVTDNWSLTIFTSGTTGTPKKVKQTLTSLTRHVKKGTKYKDDKWALAYDPTHMAGLQVFFQALFNLNSIISIFTVNALKTIEEIEKHQINCISSTPTFYRLFFYDQNIQLLSIERVTLGGERFDNQLEKRLRKVFPNAQIRNVYASTEVGSLLSSRNDLFKIPAYLKEKIKVSADNELILHKDIMSNSKEITLHQDWFHTGDIVEFVNGVFFKFLNRKNELINIGGYNVNPHEIEKEINNISFVLNSLVSSRPNRLIGNILVADIQLQKSCTQPLSNVESEITNILNKKLLKWKVPRIFYFNVNLEITRSGKKKRI